MARRSGSIVWWLFALLALIAIAGAAIILALVIGALLEPTSSSFAATASSIWTTFGPHFMAVALGATLLAALCLALGPRTLSVLVLGLAALSLAGAAFIVGSTIAAVNAAGGHIDALATFQLGKMDQPPPDRVETVTVADGKELKAAIYRPPSDAPAPVFTYIHGGGFMLGTNTETAADLRWFADNGWLVISIDYRLFGANDPTWNKAPVDVACGLAWVEANAGELGGDLGRLVLAGDSAGGNLAINLAYGVSQGLTQSDCGPLSRPSAVVVQYPAVDPVATYERGFPVEGFEPQMLMRGYVGGTPAEFPDRIKAISSASYITDKAPPTLIIEPERDALVVSDGVYNFADAARAAGVDLTLVRIPFASHVYNQIAANSLGNQARRTITEHWLEQRGLAP